MSRDEFFEFEENDNELLEDDEWDKYSLKNGNSKLKNFFLESPTNSYLNTIYFILT